MKTIRLLFVLGFILTVFSCDKDDDVELSSFDVVKETITPSYTTADIACEFSTRATVKNVFIHYSKNADFSDYEEQKMIEKDGKFSTSLSALQWNTTYYIRYAAKNSYSSAVTKKVSQAKTLEATVPTINIEQINNVLDKTASAIVALVFDGGLAVSEYGVCLSTNATPTVDGYHVVAKDKETTISLSGLKANTTYRMRAYAKNKIGVGYSKQFSFMTLDLPKVRTDDFSDIQLFSVRLHATAVSTGNDTTATFGFCWAEQTNPTIENNSTKVAVDKDTFSYLLSNLKVETTYYVRAYAKNKIGVVYGEEKSFTTQPAVKPTVSTTAATDISYTSATIGGNVTSDGGASVTERGVCYSTAQNPTTLNSKISSGSGTGSFSVSLTGLSVGITYYARAYAINSKGTSYGEQKTFTTKSYTKATVTTTAATNVSYTTAIVGGEVTFDGGTSVTERGVCYSTAQNPTTSSNKISSGRGTGSFSVSLTGLSDGITYYARAYAINSKGTSYGEQVSFTTPPNASKYVDLGLSVKWAAWNVGATKPEEYGNYYAWGETSTKSTYDWSTYKWCNGSYDTQTKYCTDSDYGSVDYKTTLELADDAARANWGGAWRMPTDAEWTELYVNCTRTWTDDYNGTGVAGVIKTSKINGNHIFLPAAGRRQFSLNSVGSYCYYWSSSLYTGSLYNSYIAWLYSLFIDSTFGLVMTEGGHSRYYGCSVRAVLVK